MSKVDFKRIYRILLRSSWQTVNIGDIAHTPGVLALIEKYIPEAEVILWASTNITTEIIGMLNKRFPKLQIVKGAIEADGKASNEDLGKALEWCDFLLHGSGPYLVANKDVEAFIKHVGKPFGVFGITYRDDELDKKLMNQAEFVYFRDSVSLERAKRGGVSCPIMDFGPDGAFAVDLRDDAKALKFMADNGLEENKFLCCIPKLRYTPYWKITNRPYYPERDARNEEMKEHDHKPLRDAIIEVVHKKGLKVLVCPEDMTQMEVGKEMLVDKLPEDVRAKVVWRENFWLPDEAVSVYTRSAGLFGNEMHSPIMCVGNGIPAIVCRFEEQTSKGFMWNDIGLNDWLFDLDNEEDVERIVPTVMELVNNPKAAREKAAKAREFVRQRQREMCETLKSCLY